jgi:hypothetical protein
VPLFIEEFTKMVQESGVLDRGTDVADIGHNSRDSCHASGSGIARLDRMEGNPRWSTRIHLRT